MKDITATNIRIERAKLKELKRRALEENKSLASLIRDIIDSYRLQAAGYIHKPATLEEFKEVMGEIEDYWLLLHCGRHQLQAQRRAF